MFTGLIQSVGQVRRHSKGLLVNGCSAFSPLKLGDSIAVDGVCLTVAEVIADGFLAVVSEETLSRTTLAAKSDRGALVNLEPALRFSDRLGGHLVSGHIDGVGIVTALEKLLSSWKLEVQWNEPLLGRYICEKASISLDGISLTVAGCVDDGSSFWIAVIPHTWSSTSLNNLVVGANVNLEADMIAKYSERLLSAHLSSKSPFETTDKTVISKDWLVSQGWN